MHLPSVTFHCDIARIDNRYVVEWAVAIVGGTPDRGTMVLESKEELSSWLASMARHGMIRNGGVPS